MCSPVLTDDWVAIKEFPFFSAENSTSSSVAFGPKNLISDVLPNKSNRNWVFIAKWIIDMNIIQLECKEEKQKYPMNSEKENLVENNIENLEMFISEFSVEKFSSLHQQICLICPAFVNELPDLPQLPKGIWRFVSSVYVPDNFEESLISYLQKALNVLGEKIFLESFFQQETVTEEEYLENLNALNRKSFADAVEDAKSLLFDVLMLRDGSINIHDMLCLYDLEDEAQDRLDLAEAILYNFDRQPFLDLREIAHQQLNQQEKKLQNMSISEEEKANIEEKCLYWETQKEENEMNLHYLQISFFENSLMYLVNCQDRMIDDRVTFGGENFNKSSANARLHKKMKEITKLSIQIFRLKKEKLVSERGEITKQVAILEGNDQLEDEIAKIEKNFFKKQMEIHKLDLKIMDEIEKLYRMKLKELKNDEDDIIENEDDTFFEAFEEQPEEFDEGILLLRSLPAKDEEIEKERREIIQKLNRIYRKRAILRNKQRKCKEDRAAKDSARKQAEDNYKLHHSIQLKRDQNRKENEDKAEFIQDMRKKTIERLKYFKKKYPNPVIKRPPRYLPPVRHTRSYGIDTQLQQSKNNRTTYSTTLQKRQNSKNKMVTIISDADLQEKCQSKQSKTKVENVNQSSPKVQDQVPAPPPLLPPPIPLSSGPIPPPPPLPPPPPQIATTFPLIHGNNIESKSVSKKVKFGNRETMGETNQITDKNLKGKGGIVDLNELIAARHNLRKSSDDVGDGKANSTEKNRDLFSFIRSGVKLKKVDRVKIQEEKGLSDIHASMLRNTLAKMNKHMADSSDEEEDPGEFL